MVCREVRGCTTSGVTFKERLCVSTLTSALKHTKRQVISQSGSYLVLTLRCVLKHTNLPVRHVLVLAVFELLFRDLSQFTLIYDNRCYI